MFTNRNAYDVLVGEEPVASISRNRDITDEFIFNSAVSRLSAELGTTVEVDLEVTLVPARRSRNMVSTNEYAISAVYMTLKDSPFQLAAADIMVDGVTIATLLNEADAKSVLDTAMRSIANASPTADNIIEMDWWGAVVEVVPRSASLAELARPEHAISALTHQTESETTHQVRGGETVWGISQQYRISRDRLAELNPDTPVVANGNIRAGQVIRVLTLRPLVSVRTVEAVTATENVAPQTIERPVPSRSRDFRRVVDEGRPGTREVTYHVVKINGVEDPAERREFSQRPVHEATPRIVEVGTQ
jgi:LysM repeat protein